MSKEKASIDHLLEEYRMIWNNRLLDTKGKSSEVTLREAIKRELLDENSHPRIRKSKFEKYYSAIKRVSDSTISHEAKVQLIKIHNEVMEE
ncbi:hypothetical protein [Bacillus sp. sid0103]|uniref:hypothetical protein n=1 Tax=Bacillus sp. sid0103 TaxID=2856337 RepID=UPI0021088DA3|nr:hypothetical protein [Bacillus sp. sid0103]